MKPIDWIMIFSGIAISALSLYIFGIGLWGLIKKRPLVFSARQFMWLMFAVFVPLIGMIFTILFEDRKYISLSSIAMIVFQIGMIALMVFILLRQMSGYMIFGISDETFREALTYALTKLNLPYQETVSKIKLTSIDADLQATVASWMGSAQIRIKQSQHAHYVKDIANEMNDYYKNNRVKVNNVTFTIYLLLGLLMAFLVMFLYRGNFLLGI